VADLLYFTGTMDCGKSTLALQMDHNHKARGRVGRIFTSHDRPVSRCCRPGSGSPPRRSRCAWQFDFWDYVVGELTRGGRIDYVVCDEAQFYSPLQIEQLARLRRRVCRSTCSASAS
jgi:thymidine kinase